MIGRRGEGAGQGALWRVCWQIELNANSCGLKKGKGPKTKPATELGAVNHRKVVGQVWVCVSCAVRVRPTREGQKTSDKLDKWLSPSSFVHFISPATTDGPFHLAGWAAHSSETSGSDLAGPRPAFSWLESPPGPQVEPENGRTAANFGARRGRTILSELKPAFRLPREPRGRARALNSTRSNGTMKSNDRDLHYCSDGWRGRGARV